MPAPILECKSTLPYPTWNRPLLKDSLQLFFWGLHQDLGANTLATVQRLFSMFPTGTPGVALLLLRLSVAATLLVDGTGYWALVTSSWILIAFLLSAILLCLGLLTPYCSFLCCLTELGVLFTNGGQNQFHLVISIANSAALAILGPGTYSFDAHIFGRRLLSFPPRKTPNSS